MLAAWTQVRSALRRELGGRARVEAVFSSFDRRATAAASLAQVGRPGRAAQQRHACMRFLRAVLLRASRFVRRSVGAMDQVDLYAMMDVTADMAAGAPRGAGGRPGGGREGER